MPKRGSYTKANLEQAVKDIQNGSSYRNVSKKYGIPKSTIEFKVKNPGHKDSFGPPPILTTTEEDILVKWIEDTARAGFPKKANDIRTSVQKFLDDNPRSNPFRNNRPGEGWLKAFLKRHPNISERTSEAVTSASSCVSENDIKKWFLEIDNYINKKDLGDVMKDPSRIYNGDETGFQICPSTGKVFAPKGTKNVYTIERGSSKESLTVMFTFSADGTICCPMIIYPYQRIPEKIASSVNPNWGIGRSDNGWMTSETFYQYIKNVFYPHLVEKNIKFPVILFVDGHKSHLNYELSLLCNQLQIEVIALYPNATRILQPADVSVFRPVKEFWRQGVREWQEANPGEILNKLTFAPLLEKVVQTAIHPQMLINGFRACGLYPFDSNAIDFSKCLGGTQNKKNKNSTVVLQQPNEVLLCYQKFLDIVGKDKIAQFESINNMLPNTDNTDFLYLFKIWKHFHNKINPQTKPHPPESTDDLCSNKILESGILQPLSITNGLNVQEPVTKINIISHIVFPSPENTIKPPDQSTLLSNNGLESSINLSSHQNDNALHSNLTGIQNYLAEPETPLRKGKKNTEKYPFAITSKEYQEMHEKKRQLKEQEEAQKEERKRKREENKLIVQKKAKKKENLELCFECKKIIRAKCLACDECVKKFHKSCIPRKHKQHIPDADDDDTFMCHYCYKEEDSDDNEISVSYEEDEETDDLFKLYKEEMKKLA